MTTPIVELLPVLANYGHRHILIPDSNWRLAGMITQAEAYAQQRRAA